MIGCGLDVGHIFRVRNADKRYRVYRVTGIYIGGKMSNGDEVENLVGVEVIDKKHGSTGGRIITECLIPEDILRSTIFEQM